MAQQQDRGPTEADIAAVAHVLGYEPADVWTLGKGAVAWRCIGDLCSRDFWDLDPATLSGVELVSAADRWATMGEGRRAIELLELALTQEERNPVVDWDNVFLEIANFYGLANDYAAAIPVLRQLIDYATEQHGADSHRTAAYRMRLAHLLIRAGEPERGLNLANQVLADRPDDPELRYSLALVLREEGRADLAIEHLEQAVAIAQENTARAVDRGDVADEVNTASIMQNALDETRQGARFGGFPVTTPPLLPDEEPILTGHFRVTIPPEISTVFGLTPFTEFPTTRPGSEIDWHDYAEEIKGFLTYDTLQTLSQTPLAERKHMTEMEARAWNIALLVATSETLAAQGFLWTVLARPSDAVLPELAAFAQAITSIKPQHIDTSDVDTRETYRQFFVTVQRLQSEAGIMRMVAERYYRDQYTPDASPPELAQKAVTVFATAPQMAAPLLAEAGAVLLTTAASTADLDVLEGQTPPGLTDWLGATLSMVQVADENGFRPLRRAAQQRQLWSARLASVRTRLGARLPEFRALTDDSGPTERALAAGEPSVTPATSPRPWGKVGRNEPCPCGSGLKYKKCCGR